MQILKRSVIALILSTSIVTIQAQAAPIMVAKSQSTVPTDASIMKLVEVIKLDESVKKINSNDMVQKSVIEALLPIFITKDISNSKRQQITEVLTNYTSSVFNDKYKERVNSANIEAYIDVTRKYFTQEEVNAQIAFYSTEIGVSIAEKQPLMTQDYANAVVYVSAQLVSDEMKKAIPILIRPLA